MTGSGFTYGSSHSTETAQRPALSCETVTVDGFAPSGSGRDHTMPSGPGTSARGSLPSRKRNPLVVYSADFRDVERGDLARCAKKLVNVVYKRRSVCCNGADDTSSRDVGSSVFFHVVTSAEVWSRLTLSCRAPASVQAASALSEICRTHPKVRDRPAACTSLGPKRCMNVRFTWLVVTLKNQRGHTW